MDSNAEELYLQNIEEYLLDDDKIVTYKWLSRALDIHVNLSKQLLYSFYSSRRDSISATYLLGGRLRSTGEDRITVVGQDEYEDVKALFESLTSEHVYSLQKVKITPLPCTLYTADSQPVEENSNGSKSYSAIKCSESVCRAAKEMAGLRITIAPVPSTSASTKVVKPASSSNAPVKVESPEKPKSEKKTDQVTKDTKKGGLAAMFAAQTSKGPAKTSSSSNASAKTNGQSSKVGISNFFNKVSKEEAVQEKPPTEKKIKEMSGGSKEDENCPGPSDTRLQKEDKSESDLKPKAKSKVTPKDTKNSKDATKSNKRGNKEKEKKEVKKRKRIVQELDSSDSDDDIFAEDGNTSPREPSPVPEAPVLQASVLESDEEDVASTSVQTSSNGRIRRKRKVIKDKTFLDDDGYMVTEKVTEYESYSESDTEDNGTKKQKQANINNTSKVSTSHNSESTSNNTKSQKPKASGKKTSPKKKSPVKKSPTKSRQQSLTSFFKKKE